MKRPPIEDMPVVRPRCAYCDKPLRLWVRHERAKWEPDKPETWNRIVRRIFTMWRGYPVSYDEPIFCTLRCTLTFAVAAHRAGYRITRKGADDGKTTKRTA